MITSSVISTISYMPSDVFKARLAGLKSSGLLDFWGFICHKGEPDNPIYADFLPEADDLAERDAVHCDKDHIHCILFLARRVDTNDLLSPVDGLSCIDAEHPELGLLSSDFFRKSRFEDWYLYCLHHPQYLLEKGEVKHYTYKPGDFVWSDKSSARNLIQESVCEGRFVRDLKIRSMLEKGGGIYDVVTKGYIRPSETFAYRNYADCFRPSDKS